MNRIAWPFLAILACVAVMLSVPFAAYGVDDVEASPSGAPAASDAGKKQQDIVVPQEIYGVAPDAAPFSLGAKAKTELSYESSDESIASIDSHGVVTLGGACGTAVITLAAAETDEYEEAQAQVSVRVTDYQAANGTMSHSMSDSDHDTGDSTGLESGVETYRNWRWGFIVRCTDPYVANHAALAVKYIVENPHFGYKKRFPESQEIVDSRSRIYEAVHEAVGDNPTEEELARIKDISTYADTSCTPTLLVGYWLYYDLSSPITFAWRPPFDKQAYTYQCGSVNVEYHQLERAIQQVNGEYRSAGKLAPFQIIYVPELARPLFFGESNVKKVLKRGDILCSCPDYRGSGHTVMMQ